MTRYINGLLAASGILFVIWLLVRSDALAWAFLGVSGLFVTVYAASKID